MNSILRSKFFRFLGSGALNTLLTYLLYLLLLQFMRAQLSYALAFLTGIFIAYILQKYIVFKTQGHRFGLAWIFVIYTLQFFLGLGLVTWWVDYMSLKSVLAPIFSAIVTVPITYVLSAKVFKVNRIEESV